MKKTLLLFFLIIQLPAFASHYLGGEITWRCFDTGPNAGKYKFYVVLYRECGTGSSTFLPNPVILSTNAPVGSISCAQVGSATDVSPDCWDATQEINCNGVTSGQGAVEERRYESGYITLNGVPPAGGWYFTFTDCCRPSITNLTSASSSYTLRAYMFPYSINGVVQNANPCYDSSPRFLEPPKSVICSGYEYTYAHNAFDGDMDSVTYDWAYPQTTSNGTNASFTTGYAYNSPFPNGGNPVSFNQHTGTMKFNPSAGGSYTSCVEVNAYRCNQKIASVYRDIPVIIRTDCGFNTPPTVQINNLPNYPALVPVVTSGDTLYYETSVFAGQEVKFAMVSQDPQLLPNFLPQTIEFSASSGQLGSPLNNANSGCSNPPCATISPKSPQTSFVSALNNEVNFNWVTNCNHISYQNNYCGTPSSRYVFSLRMQDNFCVAPAIKAVSVVVYVNSTIPVPPDLSQACVSREPAGGLTINWGYPLDTGMNFDAYVVFRGSSPSVPFIAIDTIWNYSIQSYTDMSPLSGANYYYMRSLGGCGYTSVSSDTIRLMELAITPIPPTNSSVAQLDWNAPYSGATPTYEIWRRPLGSGSAGWAQVATTSNLTFNDTVNICGQDLEYQIRINGTCNSTIEGGFFSDQTNLDSLYFTSTQVDYANSIANMSWAPSTSPDIIEYWIIGDDGNGYVPVDTLSSSVTMATIQPLPTVTTSYKICSIDSCGNISSDLLVNPFIVSVCSPVILTDLPNSDTAYTVPGSKLLYIITPNCITNFSWQEKQSTSTLWQTLQDNGTYSGTTTSALVISGINSGFNGNLYRCLISGPTAQDTSNETILHVIDNIGIVELDQSLNASINPNPSHGTFLLKVDEEYLGSHYLLSDEIGRILMNGQIDSTEIDFDLIVYPKGIYRLSIITSNGVKNLTVINQ